MITHPFLNEKIEWGMVPYVQALLLARHLRGDLDDCLHNRSENECFRDVKAGLYTDMFHFVFIVISQIVKPQAVLTFIN